MSEPWEQHTDLGKESVVGSRLPLTFVVILQGATYVHLVSTEMERSKN